MIFNHQKISFIIIILKFYHSLSKDSVTKTFFTGGMKMKSPTKLRGRKKDKEFYYLLFISSF